MQQLIENCHAAYQRFNELTAALDRGEDVLAAHEDASAALRYALMDARRARRRQAATAACRLLQAAHQIAPHPFDHRLLAVKEVGYRLQQRLQAHALPQQLNIRKAELPRRRPRHGFSPPDAALHADAHAAARLPRSPCSA